VCVCVWTITFELGLNDFDLDDWFVLSLFLVKFEGQDHVSKFTATG